MKKLLATAMCSGMLLLGAPVYAGDMAHKDAKHEQMMKDCIVKQDPSMSKDAATKACEEKMKALHEAKKNDPAHMDSEHK